MVRVQPGRSNVDAVSESCTSGAKGRHEIKDAGRYNKVVPLLCGLRGKGYAHIQGFVLSRSEASSSLL